MDMAQLVTLICSVSVIIIVGIILIIIGIKLMRYLDNKSKIMYKTLLLNSGIKKYVDETIDDYIDSYLSEYITVTPEFIDRKTLNNDDEAKILGDVTQHILTFLPDYFKEQIGHVYKIGFKYTNKSGIAVDALTDLITRRVYLKVLNLAVVSRTPKDELTTIQENLESL